MQSRITSVAMNPSEAIAALRKAGWSEVAIAKEVGSTQPTINRISREKTQPTYSLGNALVELAEQVDQAAANDDLKSAA